MKENEFVICVLLMILTVFGVGFYHDRKTKRRCNDAGGIILRDRCYETASLKIIPVQ